MIDKEKKYIFDKNCQRGLREDNNKFGTWQAALKYKIQDVIQLF